MLIQAIRSSRASNCSPATHLENWDCLQLPVLTSTQFQLLYAFRRVNSQRSSPSPQWLSKNTKETLKWSWHLNQVVHSWNSEMNLAELTVLFTRQSWKSWRGWFATHHTRRAKLDWLTEVEILLRKFKEPLFVEDSENIYRNNFW